MLVVNCPKSPRLHQKKKVRYCLLCIFIPLSEHFTPKDGLSKAAGRGEETPWVAISRSFLYLVHRKRNSPAEIFCGKSRFRRFLGTPVTSDASLVTWSLPDTMSTTPAYLRFKFGYAQLGYKLLVYIIYLIGEKEARIGLTELIQPCSHQEHYSYLRNGCRYR